MRSARRENPTPRELSVDAATGSLDEREGDGAASVPGTVLGHWLRRTKETAGQVVDKGWSREGFRCTLIAEVDSWEARDYCTSSSKDRRCWFAESKQRLKTIKRSMQGRLKFRSRFLVRHDCIRASENCPGNHLGKTCRIYETETERDQAQPLLPTSFLRNTQPQHRQCGQCHWPTQPTRMSDVWPWMST